MPHAAILLPILCAVTLAAYIRRVFRLRGDRSEEGRSARFNAILMSVALAVLTIVFAWILT